MNKVTTPRKIVCSKKQREVIRFQSKKSKPLQTKLTRSKDRAKTIVSNLQAKRLKKILSMPLAATILIKIRDLLLKKAI